MYTPKIVREILGWEGIDADDLNQKVIVLEAGRLFDIISSDYSGYITNDEDGFYESDYKELKEFVGVL